MTSLLTITVLATALAAAPDEPAAGDAAAEPTAAPAPDAPTPLDALSDEPSWPTTPPETSPPPEGDATPEGDTAPEGEAAPEGETSGAPLADPERPAPPPTAMAPVKKPDPPRPIRWRLDMGVGFGSTIVSDRGFFAFSDRRHLPEATTSVLFDFRLAEGRFFLGGGLAYQRLGRDGGEAHGQLSTELTMHEPEVLGRLSFMTLEGLDVFARFGVGPSLVTQDYYSNENASQRGVIPRVDAQGGLSLYLPKPWLARKRASRVTAGIELGMGYTWRGTIGVQPALEQDDEPLRASTSPWGDLSMQGLSWRMGLFVRVM